MTQEEEEEMDKMAEDRAKYWNMDKIKTVFKPNVEVLPEKYQEKAYELLYDRRRVFVDSSEALKGGCREWEIEAIYPKTLSLHCAKRAVVGQQRLIHERVQRIMADSRMIRRTDEPGHASHHFLAIRRPGAKLPADKTALDAMTRADLDATFRCILDLWKLIHIYAVSLLG